MYDIAAEWAGIAQSVLRLATAFTIRRVESRREARFSAPIQTGPGAHPASFPGVKRPGRGVDHPTHLAPKLKKE